MRIDRRLTILGVMLIILSTVMATQYATTKVGFSYSIVHPSNADIRYVASDNSSAGNFVYRITGANNSGQRYASLEFGNWSEGENNSYTAAFAIVNEEPFPVTITHAVVNTHLGSDHMLIYLHQDRDQVATSTDELNTSRLIWNRNATAYTNGSCAWILAAGDGDPATMNASKYWTFFNATGQVRYSYYDGNAETGVYDFVWVQISLDIPDGAYGGTDTTGTVAIYFNSAATPGL